MRLSWKIGRVAGIDLYLHPTFLLLLAYVGAVFGGLEAVALVSAVFGCVLLHEFGHALTARSLYGIQTEDITLYPIGGVARLQRMPRKPGAELLITLAGPLVNLVIAGVLAAVLWIAGAFEPSLPTSASHDFLATLMFVNLMLAAFNLIPAFPMDGGRVFRALLSGWLGRLRATEVAAGLGKFLAMGFGLWSLFQGDLIRVFLAGVIYMAATAELMRVRAEERPRHDSHDDHHGDGIWTAPPGYRWIEGSGGSWQLAPIWVNIQPESRQTTARRFWR
jgi:Zn-dependent protease